LDPRFWQRVHIRGRPRERDRAIAEGAPLAFVAIYVRWTVLMLPGVVPTLAGGALFGIVAGSLLASIGAVAGATLAFFIVSLVALALLTLIVGTLSRRRNRRSQGRRAACASRRPGPSSGARLR
jgi:hypothetical protein